MTVETTSLTGFLLARIAEDEAVAELAAGTPPAVYEGWKAWNGPGHVPMMRAERFAAECAAKRAIVELCALGDLIHDLVLAALALPYADHPDYRDEWKP